MCWKRETGVILGAQFIASVTFIAILMTILIQTATNKWLAKTGLACEITELADPASYLLLSASPARILAKLPFHFLL